MGPAKAIKTGLTKFAAFFGRAARAEFWWFILFFVFTIVLASALDVVVFDLNEVGQSLKLLSLAGVLSLILFLPAIAVGFRRLQDTGLPGWIYGLLMILPYMAFFFPNQITNAFSGICGLAAIVLCIRGSQPDTNKYGPNPHEVGI